MHTRSAPSDHNDKTFDIEKVCRAEEKVCRIGKRRVFGIEQTVGGSRGRRRRRFHHQNKVREERIQDIGSNVNLAARPYSTVG